MSNPTIIVYGLDGTSTVRVLFSNPMTDNDELLDVDNYTITPLDAGLSVPAIYKKIIAENKTYPTYVDIDCTEMTIGQTYNFEINVSTGGPTDFEGNLVDPATGVKTFAGTGKKPTIKSVEATGDDECKITFSEVMENNLDIKNPTKYTFDNGLTVLSVESVSGSEVVLKTSEQTEGTLYLLTISLT